ncbi:Efflux pump [Lachnellula subtilissima]|uniref:Efflux pump n=1 Tax=Lachnellula subtilissima TaxID=602034 RepID=A0A8H8RZJ6_9HELO|nr:Efflux pump [Lachnellula subtilissima]
MATVEMNSDASMVEKAHTSEYGGGSRDGVNVVDGGINHHAWDNHTSFNKYPTHEEGYENKLTFGFFMTMLGFSLSFVIAEVIPLFLITLFTVMAYDVGAGDKAIWLIVTQFISIGSIVPFVGPLVDLIGRKGITLLSLCLVVISMILLGTTPNIAGLIAAMAISGVSIGIQLLTSIAAVTELVPVYKRGITIGYVVIGFLPFAPASLYGQLLAEHSWRYVGLVVGVLAFVAFFILLVFYKPPQRPNSIGLSKVQVLGRVDFVGAVLGIGGITVFLVGLNWGGQDYAWHSTHVISCLTVGLVSVLAFIIWEKFGAKYPMFPWELVKHKRLFFAICTLCLTSGINYVPVVVFWTIQVYTVYGASYRQAGIYLLPIGFCIAGGAVISAIMMTIFKKKIQFVLMFFCIIQTAGKSRLHGSHRPRKHQHSLGALVLGLIGVGGVLLPSQVVFSIISPHDLIGTSVSLSIVIRAIGQVIGVSLYYNIFKTHLTRRAANPAIIAFPAIENGLAFTSLDPAALTPNITALVTSLAAGPFSAYAHLFPNIDSPEQIAAVQQAAHELYKPIFPMLYFVSIAWGGAAVVACFFLVG